MTGVQRTMAIRLSAAIAVGLLFSACAGNQSGPSAKSNDGQVLSTTETAPADLQLILKQEYSMLPHSAAIVLLH